MIEGKKKVDIGILGTRIKNKVKFCLIFVMNRRVNSFFALRRMDDIDSPRPRTLIEQSGRTEERGWDIASLSKRRLITLIVDVLDDNMTINVQRI